jgi:hypothetical protein
LFLSCHRIPCKGFADDSGTNFFLEKTIMKKLYLSVALMSALGHLTTIAQVRPGVIGGANIASYSETVTTGTGFGATSTSYSSSAIFAYHIGGLLDIPIDDHFLIQPQLLFSLKGGENQNDLKLLIHQIEIPVLVEYKFQLGIGQIYGGLGPHFGIGLGVKGKQNGVTESLTFGSGADQFKRVDVGATFTAGYLFDNGFFGALKVSPSFTNEVNADGNLHLFNFGISVGYLWP